MKTTDFNSRQIEKFISSTLIDDNGCWIWQKSFMASGYGNACFNANNYQAHRVGYAMFIGDIPSGMLVRHRCDVRACVNPKHLILGTNADNMQDVRERGTGKVVTGSGEEHFNAKLTDELVVELRRRITAGELVADLSKEWNISQTSISRAAVGKTWDHVPNPVDPSLLETKGDRHGAARKLNEKIEEQNRTGLKVCSRCDERKPLGDFGKNKSLKDGLNRVCKTCGREQASITYAKKRALLDKNH